MQDIKLTYQRLNDMVILLNAVSNQTLSDVFPRLGSRAPARCEILSSEFSEVLEEKTPEVMESKEKADEKFKEFIEELEEDEKVDPNDVVPKANEMIAETDEYKEYDDKRNEKIVIEIGNNKHAFLKQLVDKAGVKVFDKPNGKKALSDFYSALGMKDKIWEDEG